jgi:hypothetical protein
LLKKEGKNMSLTISEYVKQARSTAIYPDVGMNIYYPTLGLMGEIGEVCGKIRDLNSEAFRKEIGDVLWYVANLLYEFKLEDRYSSTFEDLRPRLTTFSETVALELTATGGQISEIVKKVMRDKQGQWDQTTSDKIALHLDYLLELLTFLCELSGCFLSDVAQANLDKLASRKARNQLQGSGDNR